MSVGIDFWLTFCVLVQCHLDWRVRPNILYVIAEWEFAMVKITPNYKHQFYSSSSLMLFISLLPSVIMERIIECQETHFLRLTVKRFRHSTDVKCELFNGVEDAISLLVYPACTPRIDVQSASHLHTQGEVPCYVEYYLSRFVWGFCLSIRDQQKDNYRRRHIVTILP